MQNVDRDSVTVTATTPVGGRELQIQLMFMATATLNVGGTPPAFMQSLANGSDELLTIAFLGSFSGSNASGDEIAVSSRQIAQRLLDRETPRTCGSVRTHNGIVDLTSPDGESLRAVVGLRIVGTPDSASALPPSYGDDATGGSGSSTGGTYSGGPPLTPMSLHPTADGPVIDPKPPADNKACGENRKYGFFFYPDPKCGDTVCYNLGYSKQKRIIKVEVDVKKEGGSGSIDKEIEVETPYWAAGFCSTTYYSGLPSYYYCKCVTQQLDPPK